MVYGYSTNEEFIDKSYQLLEKLEAKGLWNKDTLVIGLDKSVRPLCYTLKKISDVEKRGTPDIRFFNYSIFDNADENKLELFPKELFKHKKKEIENFKDYKKILLLDEYSHFGGTLETSKKFLIKILENSSDSQPEIHSAVLITSEPRKPYPIYVDKEWMGQRTKTKTFERGVKDKYVNLGKLKVRESIPLTGKRSRKQFLTNRYQLSRDIKNYLHEKHPKKISKQSLLENIIKPISIWLFVFGILFSSKTITGNIIGTFQNQNILGAILIVLGIVGFFISRKCF